MLATLIWGTCFVVQDISADIIPPFEFQAVRTLIGALVLIPFIIITDNTKKRAGKYIKPTESEKMNLILGGIICGVAQCAATCLQQYGLTLGTTAGKSGFITAMYIVFVPVIGLLFKKKIQPHVIGCIIFAIVGLYLLCVEKDSLAIVVGDFVTLLCAVAFAVHILSIDHFAKKTDCVKLACTQFIVSGTLSGIMALIVEGGFHPSLIVQVIWPILYAGVLSCGLAYTFQVIGQKLSSSSTAASLIMSFESVVAVIAGAIVLNQLLSVREIIGCLLMFIAIIASQINFSKLFKKQKNGI